MVADKAPRIIDEITSADDLARVFPVSRETVDRLKVYESALRKWQKAVNLVAPATLPVAWSRHFADSLQLARHIPQTARKLADLGSGAGFPGLVLAAAFADPDSPNPALAVTLVESDQRKAAFLRDTARAMQISVEILSTRIENDANLTALQGVDVFTARALAPLDRLFGYVAPLLSPASICVFPKGRDARKEVATAQEAWTFDHVVHASMSQPEACIVIARNIAPRAG